MPSIKKSAYILKADKLETQQRKVSQIDKNSTDEQYPSAKAVYDTITKRGLNENPIDTHSVSFNNSNNIAGSMGFKWTKVDVSGSDGGYRYYCEDGSQEELTKLKQLVDESSDDNYLSFYAVEPVESFEETDWRFIRSSIFNLEESGEYTLTIEVKDESKFNMFDVYYSYPEWESSISQPFYFGFIDNKTASANMEKGTYRIFINNDRGIKAEDIVSATLTKDGVVAIKFGNNEPQSHRSNGTKYILEVNPEELYIKASGTRYDGWTSGGWDPVEQSGYRFVGKGSTICADDFPSCGTIMSEGYSAVFGDNNRVSGGYSVGFGRNNVVSGTAAFATGRNNYVGYNGSVFGRYNTVKGQMATSFGQENTVNGHDSFAAGLKNEVNGTENTALGIMNSIPSGAEAQTVVGAANKEDKDALFIVGNGKYIRTDENPESRSNAFVVKKDGSVEIQGRISSDGVDVFATRYSSNIVGDVWDGSVATSYEGGDGTKYNPYQIKTGAQLAKMVVDGGNNNYYQLQNDIYLNDISNDDWKINKWNTADFTGNFDGQNYGIYGLYIENSSVPAGLFSKISSAIIKNLKFDYVYITASSNVGTLCGFINAGTVKNIYIGNSVYLSAIGDNGAGGLIGYLSGTSKLNLTNICSLIPKSEINSTSGQKYKRNGILGQAWGNGGINVTFDNCLSLTTIYCYPNNETARKPTLNSVSPNNNYYYCLLNDQQDYIQIGQSSQQSLDELRLNQCISKNTIIISDKQPENVPDGTIWVQPI